MSSHVIPPVSQIVPGVVITTMREMPLYHFPDGSTVVGDSLFIRVSRRLDDNAEGEHKRCLIDVYAEPQQFRILRGFWCDPDNVREFVRDLIVDGRHPAAWLLERVFFAVRLTVADMDEFADAMHGGEPPDDL